MGSVIRIVLVVFIFMTGCDRSRSSSANSSVRFRDVQVGSHTFAVAEVDLQRGDIKLYYRNTSGDRFGSFASLKAHLANSNQQLLFATNAGIFNPNFMPTGLHVENGVEISPLNVREGVGNFYTKPNGVLVIEDNTARIVESSAYRPSASSTCSATQSGPLLVIDGKINPKFSDASNNRRIRSGVGVRVGAASSKYIVFVLSRDPITFYEFAAMFRDSLNCNQALYLDGEISAFFPSPSSSGGEKHEYAGLLGVTEKR